MLTYPFKLVTIIAEPVLEQKITHDLRQLGATGFTIVEGRGQGSRGLQATEIPGSDIRIESIVEPDVADRIVAHLATTYFGNYEVIAYLSDVAVVRGDKYRKTTTSGGQ
ncbi:MAG: P-II family nitrogen regulator [Gemmatimonas sp.]|jgi:nitrogen regulatory protein P-II 2|uniref:P-II family nitrogen regulator n=1 Tax=Gemmatimonas sp. TaxID=1962908 RepID=UPI00391FC90A|nr:transcriptional regulator [Gemmatimonadota bacterium]